MERLSDDAAKLAASPLWPVGDDELTACLHAAHRLEQTAAAMQARLIHHAIERGVPATQGSRSTTGWLRSQLRLDPRAARQRTDLATALHDHPALEQALVDGLVDARQALVIADAVDATSAGLSEFDDLSPGDADQISQQAEATLIEMAERLPAYQLRRVGERILEHVAPQLAERAEEAALARQEARAHRARGFTISAPHRGMVRLSGTLGLEDAALLQAALDPLCAPAPGDERRPEQRRADALADVCRLALRTKELPANGGEPAQLAVTVGYDPLTRALSAATTETGTRLSAATARRLACDARILPAVLGGSGQVLDLGRSQRLASGPLRRALHLRDRGCAFPDCDRPPRWTDMHHLKGWAEGGATVLENLVLLCRRHHRDIHHPDSGWQIRLGADGLPEFIPPATIDPERRPRRNLYHRPHRAAV
ncbi:DUF222 domain-containing protein [Actinoplanes sp. NPDC049596]|uniref:HNH endonuclease signature motif containing protein n=1 Tax=unclassified Actinoplanes TaxID=2626549 RepID=UPI0034219B4E